MKTKLPIRLFLSITLIVISIIAFGYTSVAHADYDQVIRFRNIPWGTSATEFFTRLQAEGLYGRISTFDRMESWELDKDDPAFTFYQKECYYSCNPTDSFTVAGVPVYNINAHFAYTHDDENVYYDEEKTSLYRVAYYFNPTDKGATYPYLQETLTSLYGRGEEKTIKTNVWNLGGNDYTRHFVTTTWHGTNRSAVRLELEYQVDSVTGETKYNSLELHYGRSNSANTLKKLKEAIGREELEQLKKNSNTNGL